VLGAIERATAVAVPYQRNRRNAPFADFSFAVRTPREAGVQILCVNERSPVVRADER